MEDAMFIQVCDNGTCGDCYRCQMESNVEELLESIECLLGDSEEGLYRSHCNRDRLFALECLEKHSKVEILQSCGKDIVAKKVT